MSKSFKHYKTETDKVITLKKWEEETSKENILIFSTKSWMDYLVNNFGAFILGVILLHMVITVLLVMIVTVFTLPSTVCFYKVDQIHNLPRFLQSRNF